MGFKWSGSPITNQRDALKLSFFLYFATWGQQNKLKAIYILSPYTTVMAAAAAGNSVDESQYNELKDA